MLSFHFNRSHENRDSFKAESIDHLRDLLKCSAFRPGYKAIAAFDVDLGSYHKVYGKDANGIVNVDDHIGNLYQGDVD